MYLQPATKPVRKYDLGRNIDKYKGDYNVDQVTNLEGGQCAADTAMQYDPHEAGHHCR